MTIDDFMFEMFDEYDGFKFKSTLSEDEIRVVMANYAMACLHDKALAQEAWNITEAARK